ncbi:hypothetical protein ASF98_11485 [Arthrobacter sp. Leaf337]|nr:hypothetical protein ASF98_11485 [Arthrobacter sp. Leaf337]
MDSHTQLLVHLGPNVLNSDFPHGRLRSAIVAAGFTSVERSSLSCERRQAPRSEPAPIRTGAVDPPSVTSQQHGDRVISGAVPPEPDLPALTVIRLSISRT